MIAGMNARVSRLIDREPEKRELRALLEAGAPRLALLTGRRRVGKTYLLNHLWPPQDCFLFTAARTTPELNRRQLITDLARWSGLSLYPEDYPTWRTVFTLLLELRAPLPLVIALDEFQYLAEDRTGLAEVASELNAAWERPREPRPLLLILAGSVVSTMEALATGGAPLYGRFHWQGRLEPFDYRHAAEMTPFPSLRDRAAAYGVFGGTPRYLAAVDAERPLATNIADLMLRPTGEIRNLLATALDQEEGLRDAPKYRAILRAVAAGKVERNEIAQRAGLSNDSALRDKLDRLVELGYLETRQNLGARPNAAIRYRIADPAQRFHHRFVEPNTSLLERTDPYSAYASAVEHHFDTYLGLEFERMVPQAYDLAAARDGLPLVAEWRNWEGHDRDRLSPEIDIAAPLVAGGIMTGSVKWTRDPLEATVHREHMRALQRAAAAGHAWAHTALDTASPLLYVAAGGFHAEFRQAAEASGHPTILWSLEDMYEQF